ncbi:flagellar biosynthesis protein FlhF [candidate division KSB1 bacterium]|nr:flagellar biosynthesis protein FlhF [candidate division KSB1 bacterium]
MKIKKFVAPTIKQALAQVKQEMGDDAVILNSRKIEKNGIRDVFSKDMYEVTAALDEFDRPKVVPQPRTVIQDTYIPEPKQSTPPPSRSKDDWKSMERLTQLSDEMNEIKEALAQMAGQGKQTPVNRMPHSMSRLYLSLIEAGVHEETAQGLVEQISDALKGDRVDNGQHAANFLRGKMAEKINTQPLSHSRDGRPLIVSLIGPTGVGKTTTLAKMATHPAIYGSDKVAFISTDTYRIAAIEQLRTFARIANIPLEVTYSDDEIQKAIFRHRDKDVILIDTPGRSPGNAEHLKEIHHMLERIQPDEVHLVLSICTRFEDIVDIIKKYTMMHVNRLLFTKLDETTGPGNLINVVDQFHTPLSFITNGQEVPDDIMIVEASQIANLVLAEVE